MPNHHIVGAGDVEKGGFADYDKQTHSAEEPFVHGAATVGEATGRGGDTHRGLKSRHIQFLYAEKRTYSISGIANSPTELSVVRLEQVSSLDPVPFLRWSVLPRYSWLTWL